MCDWAPEVCSSAGPFIRRGPCPGTIHRPSGARRPVCRPGSCASPDEGVYETDQRVGEAACPRPQRWMACLGRRPPLVMGLTIAGAFGPDGRHAAIAGRLAVLMGLPDLRRAVVRPAQLESE